MKLSSLVGIVFLLMGGVVASHAEVVSNYFADAGFEALDGSFPAYEPNAGTSPWFTTGENADGSFKATTNEANSGSQSVVFDWYGDSGAIVQDLNALVDAGITYEVSLWMLTAEPSANGVHVNPPTLNIGLYTSTNSGASYQFAQTLYTGALNSTTNVWEQFSVAVDGAALAAFAGQDIQIRFNKANENTRYKIYIDDAEFGEYAVDTPPSSVLIGYYGSTGTNVDYAAAGIGGALFNDNFRQVNANAGSTDGTYGSTNGASLLLTAYEVRIGNDPVSNIQNRVGFRIDNNTGLPLQLDSISFDYARWNPNSPTNLTLIYSYGDLGTSTVVNTASVISELGGNSGDYDDFDWSLAGLSDQVLGNGESATFRLEATGAAGAFASGAFDNIAIMGKVPTPPPSMLIGWSGSFGTNTDYNAAGIEGSLFKGAAYGVTTNAGSTDGTYGSTNGASVLLTAYEVRVNTNAHDKVGFQIRNETGAFLQLDSISFDYSRWFNLGPTNAVLSYAYGDLSGVTNDTPIFSLSVPGNSGKVGDYLDYDVSLSGLAGRVLAPGDAATFNLIVSDAGGEFSPGAFDNIAIFGGAFAGTAYDAWSTSFGLTNGPTGDHDLDGILNLVEFAQNGDPTNSASLGTAPVMGSVIDGGATNWIEYIYLKRTSTGNGLSYSIQQNPDLIYGAWTNYGDIVQTGSSPASGGFKSITNQVPTDGKTKEFLRLQITK